MKRKNGELNLAKHKKEHENEEKVNKCYSLTDDEERGVIYHVMLKIIERAKDMLQNTLQADKNVNHTVNIIDRMETI
uniref:Uncharacterized protein n=1 Tax=Romanomermis culicivorax TaxID=13658 RepID=A0A915J8W1_ROMCU